MDDFSYSGDPTSSQLDEVRFLISDTDDTMGLLADTEIAYLIGKWFPIHDSLIFVAAVAADQIATKFAGVLNVTADGVVIATGDLMSRYQAISARLRAQYKDEGVPTDIDISDVMWGSTLDPGIRPLSFSKGMHDNLYAGEQDFGGEGLPYAYEWSWNESGP